MGWLAIHFELRRSSASCLWSSRFIGKSFSCNQSYGQIVSEAPFLMGWSFIGLFFLWPFPTSYKMVAYGEMLLWPITHMAKQYYG